MQWFIDNKDAVVSALTAIGVAFGSLKLASLGADLMKVVNGFKGLGLGGAAGDAVAGTGGGGVAAGGGGGGGIGSWIKGLGADGVTGLFGLAAIPAAFAWAIDRRQNHAELVRGTDENFAANVGGYETLMAEWITANKQFDELEFTASDAEIAALQNKITAAYQKLSESEEGIKALQAYSDWRQEHSLGNMDWEMPEYLSAAAEATNSLTTEVQNMNTSAGAMTDAANNLMTLPENMATAVANAVGNITITINQGGIDAIGRRVFGNGANHIKMITK
jgi:hypothetical protein